MSQSFEDKMGKELSRRQFLGGTLAAATMALFGPSLLTQAFAAAEGDYEVLSGDHWGGLRAIVKGGRFVEAIPFEKDPFPTSLVKASSDYVYSPSRVKYPMVRAGFLKNGHKSDTSERGTGKFVRVSWEKATKLVASELKRVKEQYGVASIYGGNPGWRKVGKLHNSTAGLGRLLNLNGGCTRGSGDYSTGASQVIMGHVMGNMEVYSQQTVWPVIIESSDLVVMWGSDLINTDRMGWGLPDHGGQVGLEALKKSGKKVVVIDPLRSDTAEYVNADWIAPRPGSDVAMMLGVAHTLYTQKLYDEEFLDEYTVGFDKFKAYLTGESDGQPKTPEWASEICDVDAKIIKTLARTMAKGRTMLMAGWSLQRADHGEQTHWMIVTIASMLGQIGLPGGGFGLAYHYDGAGSPQSPMPSYGAGLGGFSAGSAPKKMPPTIPVARISDALLNPGQKIDFNGGTVTYPDIKLMYWAGGNPLHHQQDRNKLVKAWQKPETIIVHEMFWTATAKYADIVLPTATTFEQDDIEGLGDYSARFIYPLHKVIDPLYESKPTYDIFAAIAEQLGYGQEFTEGKSKMDWIESFYNAAVQQAKSKKINIPDFKTFWEGGSYVEFDIPESAKQWVRHADFREDPLLEPLGTASGKIELYCKAIEKMGYDDCPPHASWQEPVEWLGSKKTAQFPLHLLSSHPKDRLHSQMNNVTSLREKYAIKDREPIWMNTKDAAARGIQHGDIVRVFNDRGEVLAGAYVTDRFRKGVVRLREGGWYDPKEPGKIGSLCKYGHVNVLTIDKGSSKLSQANIANTALVQVKKFTGTVPKVTAFDPPKGA
ncbi:MAG: trimethylamine-N-oxide reductase TorA [Deltaproteobacteria bacterium]|uniref:trimethylamine-N-oxide reductase TorA n=1 Tax=Desulfobacula sp. TaxID=2593537 RepID=UPI0019C6DD44|nr:trimethylamine-N-oxide reductase TorA [Candidatus Desulfobacula maris]MBL6995747.1 trimethylamine-N-oxide reductase TorA [Desulfobacula sp.]